MTPRPLLALSILCAGVSLATAPGARAADEAPAPPPAPAATDDVTAQARAAFLQGTDLVHRAQWAEALSSFEKAARLKPHAIVTYNIGACERAMGQYTRARASFITALSQNTQAGGEQLSSSLAAEAGGFVHEIDGLLARAEVDLQPQTASIAVDGRPLEIAGEENGVPLAFAGTRPPGAAEAAPGGSFVLVLDPGAHIVVLSRPGYAEAVVSHTFAPGSRDPLKLLLDTLPATIHISANQPGAVVSIDGTDVGTAPTDVSRHEGTYQVTIKKHGFVTYDARVPVKPGANVDIVARLEEDNPPISAKWWFLTGAGVLLGGAALTTYFATRPTPDRPAPNGGSLGWAVQLN